MAGVALILEVFRRNNNLCTSSSQLVTAATVSAAAASISAASAPFASKILFRIPIAHCDVGESLTDIYFPTYSGLSKSIRDQDFSRHHTKEYYFEAKPIFSAFQWKQLVMTSLRSFLLFYLPLLETRLNINEDEDDELFPDTEQQPIDFVVPFKKSMRQIVLETTVVTTRRILERVACHCFSRRTAWKLLKDVPKSTVRKAESGYPVMVYIFRVSRTTLRAHFLGVAASWIVQVGIEVYRFLFRDEGVHVNNRLRAKGLGNKVTGISVRCGASLVFASIGAGIGATLIRPSTGQRIGCAVGDLVGPTITTIVLHRTFHIDV